MLNDINVAPKCQLTPVTYNIQQQQQEQQQQQQNCVRNAKFLPLHTALRIRRLSRSQKKQIQEQLRYTFVGFAVFSQQM